MTGGRHRHYPEFSPLRSIFLAPLCAIICAVSASAQDLPGPSVRDVVEFTRIDQPQSQNEDALREQVSPDGKQAFIVTRKADVASDNNVYEIRLLDMRPDRLASQQSASPVTVFSAVIARDNSDTVPGVQDVRWHGDRTLVFLARLDGESFQVYRFDVPKRELTQLTHEKNFIVAYAASQDLQRVVYAAQVPNPPLAEGAHDVVVGTRSFWSVKFGQHDLRSQDRIYQYFTADVASSGPPHALGDAFPSRFMPPVMSISPDGRWALLHRYKPDRLADWARQYPMIAESANNLAASRQADPQSYYSTPITYVPRLTTAWRLDDGFEQTVVDAPDDALSGSEQLRADRLWQGAGTSVIMAGTHLPLKSGGKTSLASHVIEYWPDSGRWVDVTTLEGRLKEMRSLPDGFLVIDGAKRREFHRQANGGWRESAAEAEVPAQSGSAWRLRVIQGLNQPPDIYASGPHGEVTRLTALNPQFDASTWGSMQSYNWRDASGRHWEGGLMSGSGMDKNTRYPLLIQTYKFAADRFFLDGPNASDGYTSAFAGRAFLREGILVLAMPWSATDGAALKNRPAFDAFNESVRGAVDQLVKEGRVDPSRVGIMGWSATGERVLNLVAFGDVPIRAATLADGDAGTLFSFTLTYGTLDSTWVRKEDANGGPPFGKSLANWVRNDPSLHTDCIRAAMRIETYGPWVLNNWDVYALLRRQYKAAEMVVLPDGTHQLSTPSDRMVSLQGNVDWYGFWLAGKTRTIPVLASETTASVAEQFRQWRQMEALKAADDARPRCTR